MIVVSPLDSATRWLNVSNVLYITGAIFTALTAAWVLYETRAVALGKQAKYFLLSEVLGVISAIICVLGSVGAIRFGNVVGHLKDVSLAEYEKQADLKIAQAQKDTATANQNAQNATLAAQEIAKENTGLTLELKKHEKQSASTEAELMEKNKKLDTFSEGLAQQQQGMAQQLQTTPSLNQSQIVQIANQLRPFAIGSKASIHMMMDARCARLGGQIHTVFDLAGIGISTYSTDVGPNFQGVIVAVKNASPAPHPPFADALLTALKGAGVAPHPVVNPALPEGEVGVYIGPE